MKLLSYAALEDMGLGCRSTIWRMIRSGDFPPPIRIGIKKVAWPEQQILDWIEARATEKWSNPLVKPDKRVRA